MAVGGVAVGVLGAALMVLGACGPAARGKQPISVSWEKSQASRADYDTDWAQCDYEVSSTVPPASYHPFATNMFVVLQDQINISNTDYRVRSLMEKCLMAKGWHQVIIYADGTTNEPEPSGFTPQPLR